MRLSHIFQRVYCSPVAISADGFRSIDAAVRPFLLNQAPMVDPENASALRHIETSAVRKRRPRPTLSPDGKTIVDPRPYGVIEGAGIAVIPVKGVLARNVTWFDEMCLDLSDYGQIDAAIRQALADPAITDLLIDIDSPGGECTGCMELADTLFNADKPVWTYGEGMATSAAYAQLAQGDEAYITRTTLTGSIGVITGILDDTAAMEEEGLKMDYFTAGANKLAYGGSGYTLTDSDREKIQARVDYFYGLFTASVTAARGKINTNPVEPIASKSAGIYIGEQAVAANLVDGIVGGFDDMVNVILDSRSL